MPDPDRCPFCQSDIIWFDYWGEVGSKDSGNMVCQSCGAEGPSVVASGRVEGAKLAAILRWNVRPLEQGLKDSVSILNKQSEDLSNELQELAFLHRKLK